MSLKKLNERHRQVYDNAAPARKLVAEFPASRYSIETTDELHRVFETRPAEGENHPIADVAQHPLISEQETSDRAAVNDAALPMPARLAALNRLNKKTS